MGKADRVNTLPRLDTLLSCVTLDMLACLSTPQSPRADATCGMLLSFLWSAHTQLLPLVSAELAWTLPFWEVQTCAPDAQA